MKIRRFQAAVRNPLRFALMLSIAIAPSADVLAQTYGAQQAVRRSVDGLGAPADPSSEEFGPSPVPQPQAPPPTDPSAAAIPGRLDTTYIPANASAVVVVRPAQILAAPTAELLPREVASIAAMASLGVDMNMVDEVVAFLDVPAYGATIKFNQPFRGASIPPHVRPMVQLGDLAGRKYLKSGHPSWPSFYGANTRTLIVAPDAAMIPLIESAGQPKTGPLLDRIREVPSGYDLYVAIDVASLRPLIQMAQASLPPNVPADAKEMLGITNLIAAAEFTLNMSAPGPTSLVLHANDEAAAQQIEAMFAGPQPQPGMLPDGPPVEMNDPFTLAMASYRERMKQLFRRQRSGSTVTLFHIDGNNPAQQQVVSAVVVGLSMLGPAIEAAGKAAAGQAQADAANDQPGSPDGLQDELPDESTTAEPAVQ